MSIKDDIKAEALRLGFSLVGITTTDPPDHLEVYDRWLSDKRHGDMTYLASEHARQRRADPGSILQDSRSVLSLGIRYPSPEDLSPPASSILSGRLAAYACGDDYHLVIPPRLDNLVAILEKITQKTIRQRRYTDTGPILEREFSQRAGLGWIGKNTCLISPLQGSFFLLAEIFLNIELEPDTPFLPDRCGSCTRCIEACPTGCILPDRTLDATRCISYLTIELKGYIPTNLRPLMGNWCFGCDVCQQVCPWNLRFTQPASEPSFAPRPGFAHPDLRKEILLTSVEFRQRFHQNPVLRAKRRGYLRTVAVALGNHKDPAAVPELTQVMRLESEPIVRAHAAWALGQIGGRRSRQILEKARHSEIDLQVINEILSALAK